jgi:hypothetical protein
MFDRLEKLLNDYGKQVTNEMKNRLIGYDKVASGNLLKSIGYQLEETSPGILELTFFMADYGVYVDKGRKPGKMPPLSPIKKWLRIKGLPEKAAFPIAKNIGRFGIKPTNFFTIPISRRVKALNDQIIKITTEEVVEEIKKSI